MFNFIKGFTIGFVAQLVGRSISDTVCLVAFGEDADPSLVTRNWERKCLLLRGEMIVHGKIVSKVGVSGIGSKLTFDAMKKIDYKIFSDLRTEGKLCKNGVAECECIDESYGACLKLLEEMKQEVCPSSVKDFLAQHGFPVLVRDLSDGLYCHNCCPGCDCSITQGRCLDSNWDGLDI